MTEQTIASAPTERRRRISYDPIIFALGLLMLWQGAHYLVGGDGLASPWETFRRAGQLLGSASFWPNVAATGIAFVYALLITVCGGLAIGLVLGYLRLVGEIFEPIIGATYAIQRSRFTPLFFWFAASLCRLKWRSARCTAFSQ